MVEDGPFRSLKLIFSKSLVRRLRAEDLLLTLLSSRTQTQAF